MPILLLALDSELLERCFLFKLVLGGCSNFEEEEIEQQLSDCSLRSSDKIGDGVAKPWLIKKLDDSLSFGKNCVPSSKIGKI